MLFVQKPTNPTGAQALGPRCLPIQPRCPLRPASTRYQSSTSRLTACPWCPWRSQGIPQPCYRFPPCHCLMGGLLWAIREGRRSGHHRNMAPKRQWIARSRYSGGRFGRRPRPTGWGWQMSGPARKRQAGVPPAGRVKQGKAYSWCAPLSDGYSRLNSTVCHYLQSIGQAFAQFCSAANRRFRLTKEDNTDGIDIGRISLYRVPEIHYKEPLVADAEPQKAKGPARKLAQAHEKGSGGQGRN
jgi:hypothetical protein